MFYGEGQHRNLERYWVSVMQRAMIILNPSSGNEEAKNYKDFICDVVESKGYDLTMRETEKAHDATLFAREAAEKGYDYVIAVGGDGTINEAVSGLAEQKYQPLFSLVPFGTVNDFARAIGVPLKPEQAIQWVKEANTEQLADIGKINDRYFVNVVALGAIAEAT